MSKIIRNGLIVMSLATLFGCVIHLALTCYFQQQTIKQLLEINKGLRDLCIELR